MSKPTKPNIDEIKQSIRQYLLSHPQATILELCFYFHLKRISCHYYLRQLLKNNEIVREPQLTGKSGRPRYLYSFLLNR